MLSAVSKIGFVTSLLATFCNETINSQLSTSAFDVLDYCGHSMLTAPLCSRLGPGAQGGGEVQNTSRRGLLNKYERSSRCDVWPLCDICCRSRESLAFAAPRSVLPLALLNSCRGCSAVTAALAALPLAVANAVRADDGSGQASSRMSYSRFLVSACTCHSEQLLEL